MDGFRVLKVPMSTNRSALHGRLTVSDRRLSNLLQHFALQSKCPRFGTRGRRSKHSHGYEAEHA